MLLYSTAVVNGSFWDWNTIYLFSFQNIQHTKIKLFRVIMVNFEQINHIDLVFHCSVWTCYCWLGEWNSHSNQQWRQQANLHRDHPFTWYNVRKIFRKINISYLLIRARTFVCLGVKMLVSRKILRTYVPHELSLFFQVNNKDMKANSLTVISIYFNFQNFYYLIDWCFKENLSLAEKKTTTTSKPIKNYQIVKCTSKLVIINTFL